MRLFSLRYVALIPALFLTWHGIHAFAQAPVTRLNPTIKQIVDQVSQERIGATMKHLGEYGTRYVGSEQDSETRGIGAAQRWIEAQFKSYSPKLEVSLDHFSIKKSQRVPKDVDLANVVAILPGKIDKDRYVVISGHYDSIAARRSGASAPTMARPAMRPTWTPTPPASPTMPAVLPPPWNWRA